MKLYSLIRGDKFRLREEAAIPPDAPEGDPNEIYTFNNMDGMYANVDDPTGSPCYFAGWTEVERV